MPELERRPNEAEAPGSRLADRVECRYRLGRQADLRHRQILLEMGERRGAGDQQDVGQRWSSRASATCIAVLSSRFATMASVSDWSGLKPPKGEEGHLGNALRGKAIDQRIVVADRSAAQTPSA